MSFWANVFLGRRPSGLLSSGQMSFWANVLLGKCLSGQMSSGQMSFWANVFLGKRLLGKRIRGKSPSGQMSFWANVVWADVFWANVVLGKCLWANVSWQMSYGQMSGHPSNHMTLKPTFYLITVCIVCVKAISCKVLKNIK
jgi:hypothetical protein